MPDRVTVPLAPESQALLEKALRVPSWYMVRTGGSLIAAFASFNAAERYIEHHAAGLAVSTANYQIVECARPTVVGR